MRPVTTAGFGVAVAAALLLACGGCTFLISFDDVPKNDAGTQPDVTSRPPSLDTGTPDAVADSGDDRGAIPMMPACDTSFPLEDVKGCANFVEGGQVCADNAGLTSYPGNRTTDVVTCSKTGATCVRHCVACAHNPPGFPDQCDQCIGMPDGRYCGTDMGWQPASFRLRVTCTNGRMSAVTACSSRGCDSKGGTGDAECTL